MKENPHQQNTILEPEDLKYLAYFKENREKIGKNKYKKLKASVQKEGIKQNIVIIPIDENEPDVGYWKNTGKNSGGEWVKWDKSFPPEWGVVDGQHRADIAKEEQIDVPTIIDKVLKREDIKLINNSATKWSLIDYAIYNVDTGVKDADRLLEKIKIYKNKSFSIEVIARSFSKNKDTFREDIKREGFIFDENGSLPLDAAFLLKEYLGNGKQYKRNKTLEAIENILKTHKGINFALIRDGLMKLKPEERENWMPTNNKEQNIEYLKALHISGQEMLSKNNLTEIDKEVYSTVSSRNPTLSQRNFVLDRDKNTCQICYKSKNAIPNLEIDIDHILPYDKGGKTHVDNLQVTCADCNKSKGNVYLEKESVQCYN